MTRLEQLYNQRESLFQAATRAANDDFIELFIGKHMDLTEKIKAMTLEEASREV